MARVLALVAIFAAGAEALHSSHPAPRAPISQRVTLRARAAVRAADDKKEEALYEDDAPPKLPPKPPVSKSMRDRLIKENRALGGDPDASNGNPILVVSVVIAVLAILVVGGGMA
ncbi:hypothetical protein KFE25_002448 [Diacronema lutheri]|uniref:Uncharacterized protein n=2 Tax=Diacronema lutheri TaxID=2081491 RepID=A0A8J6C5P6_DIALT|nr:hypothetical protein KFE25_002448 [Diacronema lutheri]